LCGVEKGKPIEIKNGNITLDLPACAPASFLLE
jgi:hypothetical protein